MTKPQCPNPPPVENISAFVVTCQHSMSCGSPENSGNEVISFGKLVLVRFVSANENNGRAAFLTIAGCASFLVLSIIRESSSDRPHSYQAKLCMVAHNIQRKTGAAAKIAPRTIAIRRPLLFDGRRKKRQRYPAMQTRSRRHITGSNNSITKVAIAA